MFRVFDSSGQELEAVLREEDVPKGATPAFVGRLWFASVTGNFEQRGVMTDQQLVNAYNRGK